MEQNLSNGVEFGKKEQFMMCFNDFIRSYKEKMEKYFERIVSFTSKQTVNSNLHSFHVVYIDCYIDCNQLKGVADPTAITVEDLHFLHRILTHNESKIIPLFKDKSESQVFLSSLLY